MDLAEHSLSSAECTGNFPDFVTSLNFYNRPINFVVESPRI